VLLHSLESGRYRKYSAYRLSQLESAGEIMSLLRPTSKVKWFLAENIIDGKMPLAQIAGYRENGPRWYCLKQLWIDEEDGSEEWLDIEVCND
jgi:hypothetical protein